MPNIKHALELRTQAGKNRSLKLKFYCVECEQPVRAHKAGGLAGAHFEHLRKSTSCSLI